MAGLARKVCRMITLPIGEIDRERRIGVNRITDGAPSRATATRSGTVAPVARSSGSYSRVPVFQCSRVPVFPCSRVPVLNMDVEGEPDLVAAIAFERGADQNAA